MTELAFERNLPWWEVSYYSASGERVGVVPCARLHIALDEIQRLARHEPYVAELRLRVMWDK